MDPQCNRNGHAISIQHFQHVGGGAGDTVDVEVKVTPGPLETAGVEQRQHRMKHGCHVVQTGVEHVGSWTELGVSIAHGFQHVAGAGGWWKDRRCSASRTNGRGAYLC
jgi:hypothetical protein